MEDAGRPAGLFAKLAGMPVLQRVPIKRFWLPGEEGFVRILLCLWFWLEDAPSGRERTDWEVLMGGFEHQAMGH